MPKMEVFSIFLYIRSLEFFVLSLVPEVEKNDVFEYYGKIKKWPFFGKIWVIFCLKSQLYIACGFSLNQFFI